MSVVSKFQTEKRNSKREHGQTMEQKRDMFCICNSGVANYQSHKVATVRENILENEKISRSGKSQGISFSVREI